MTECTMVFNSETVRAIFEGRKTQARRAMVIQTDYLELGLRRVTAMTKLALGRPPQASSVMLISCIAIY